GVDANPLLGELGRRRPCKRAEGCLRRGISARPCHPKMCIDRGVQDYGASATEHGNGRLQCEPGAFHVDAEDLFKVCFAHGLDGASADDSRVKEQDVEPAVFFGNASEKTLDLSCV